MSSKHDKSDEFFAALQERIHAFCDYCQLWNWQALGDRYHAGTWQRTRCTDCGAVDWRSLAFIDARRRGQ